jgi:hypothetical protein
VFISSAATNFERTTTMTNPIKPGQTFYRYRVNSSRDSARVEVAEVTSVTDKVAFARAGGER